MGNSIEEGLSASTASPGEIASDIRMLELQTANAFFVGNPQSKSGEWVLVDTGPENSGDFIGKEAEKRFGKGSRPKAIILTHGHSNHAGSAKRLSGLWNVPVYLHPMEMPLIGCPAVPLPKDSSVPGMPGWCWIHTPGHTEGHIALFRERDGMLIAGDALAVAEQKTWMPADTQGGQNGEPTRHPEADRKKGRESICRIKDLDPCMIFPGHGRPMKGDEVPGRLKYLADHFGERLSGAFGIGS